MMNEKDRKELIEHIREQSQGEPLPQSDAFEDALFEARVRAFLIEEGR